MDDYYAVNAPVLAHLCPVCHDYTLEAPQTFDPKEVDRIFQTHVQECFKRKFALPDEMVR
jgi:hypothetical protein